MWKWLPGVVAGLAVGAAVAPLLNRGGNDGCLTGLELVDAEINAGSTDYFFAIPDGPDLRVRLEHDHPRAGDWDIVAFVTGDGPAEVSPSALAAGYGFCPGSTPMISLNPSP